MAHRKYHRSTRRNKRSSKNLINKAIKQTVSVTKSTSKKYMPKVKSGLENVGSKVVKTGEQSIPFLQSMTRKFFGMFSTKTRKHSIKEKNNNNVLSRIMKIKISSYGYKYEFNNDDTEKKKQRMINKSKK